MERKFDCRRPNASWHHNIGIRPSAGGKPTAVEVLYRSDFDDHGHVLPSADPIERSSDAFVWTHSNDETDIVFWRFALHEIEIVHLRAA